jgi:hypothetical protein
LLPEEPPSSVLEWRKEQSQSDKVATYVNYLKNYLLVEGYYFAFRYDLSLSRSAHAAGFPSKKKFIWNLNIGQHF